MFLILAISSWWLYLLVKFGENHPNGDKFFNMIKWEGISFLVLFTFISITILVLFLHDIKRTNATNLFFSTITHELKTPLSSIQLQSEVMKDLIASSPSEESHAKLNNFLARLIEDTQKLELKLDEILQLARIDQGGNLNIQSISLTRFLQTTLSKIDPRINCTINCHCDNDAIQADASALNLIIRNLIDNSIKHAKSHSISLNIRRHCSQYLLLEYSDGGTPFTGEMKKLGKLFYKHNSAKGTGLGIYLIKKLMLSMKGELLITNKRTLVFTLKLLTTDQQQA